MELKKVLLYLILIMSTFYAFIQTAGIIRIDVLLIIMFVMTVVLLFIAKKVRFNNTAALYLLVLLLMCISLFYTVDTELTVTYIYVMVYGFVLFVCCLSHKDAPDCLIKVLLAFSLINVFVTIFSILAGDSFTKFVSALFPKLNTKFEFASGILGQTGTNSYVIVYSCLYYWINIIASSEKKTKHLIFLLLSVFALLLTGKRGPLIWLVATAMIVDLVFQNHTKASDLLKSVFKYIGIILVIVLFFVTVDNIDIVSNALSRFIVDQEKDFSSGRFKLYEKGIQYIKDNFFFGVGAGAYNHFGQGVHNDYLQIIAENGIFSSLLFFAFILLNLKNAFRTFKNTYNKIIALYFLGLQIFMALNALTGTSYLHYGLFFIYIEVCSCNYVLYYHDEITEIKVASQ